MHSIDWVLSMFRDKGFLETSLKALNYSGLPPTKATLKPNMTSVSDMIMEMGSQKIRPKGSGFTV